MQRLKNCEKFIDWLDPLHEIAMEKTGLDDFGEDKSYLLGLRKLLQQQDECCDLKSPLGYSLKLIFMLEQRLLAERRFKENPQVLERKIEQPLVISGMVRSGTTAMQHLAAGDPNRQHLQNWMSEYPQPRPPREAWKDHPDFQACRERLEGMYERVPETRVLHHAAAELPDECGHLLAQTFTDEYWQICSRVPLYNEWYERCDMRPAYRQHKKLLQLIGSNEPGKPWTIKYPVHLKHLKSFLQVYPDARIIWLHRDPASVMSSYTHMNAINRALSVRPETLDRGELLREQVEGWAEATARAVEIRKQCPQSQFADVHFEDYVASPVEQTQKAYQHLGIKWTPAAERGMKQWHGRHHRGGRSKPRNLAPLTLSRGQIQERFSVYINACNVNIN